MTEVKYMTVQEVAEIFRRNVRTIYRWIEEKNPIREFVRVRDGVLIPEHEVKRILAEGQNNDISDIAPHAEPSAKRPGKGWVRGWDK